LNNINYRKEKEMKQHKPFGSFERYFKRPLDFICGMVAVVVFCWLYIILIIFGFVLMRGNPFFVQERLGKNEKIFKLIKFRSMDNRRDKAGNLLPDNIRLNKYGRLLRKTSLDELPQAFNIIKGDMSVIGPRPLLVKYRDLYNEEQRKRHAVRPGLSGYAQVNGRNAVSWEDKFAMDVWYVNHITFKGDLKILFQTIRKVFIKQEGINSAISETMEEFKGTPEGVVSTWRAER
jgi:undecaprenyl phosphate N,N'-diacetylbacillosamine 1-phosphate transferase